MAPSRTGPQGTTMEDLRRVTGNITRLQPSAPRMLPTQQIVSNIVGGPLPTYGKKYGGYPTGEQFQQAIIGSLDPFVFARDLAMAQAAQNRADLAAQTRFQPRTPQDYDRLRAEEDAVRAILARPLTPGISTAAKPPAATLSPDQQSMMGEYQSALTGIQPAATPDMGWFARGLAERKAAEESKAEAYGRAMERMNAVAFREPGAETYGQRGGRAVSMQDVAAQRLGTPVTGAQAAEQTRLVEGAQDLARLNVSDLARQIAEQRYGVDPALASGMFGPEFAREFGVRQLGEQGVFPDQSIEEYIGLTQGPDALAQYQQNRVQAALDKQAEGFRTAEEEAYDLELERATGINVDAAAGDRSRATARQYLTQPNFVSYINATVGDMVQNPADTAEAQKNRARLAAQDYFTQTGDAVGAEILLNALLSFDFTLGFPQG